MKLYLMIINCSQLIQSIRHSFQNNRTNDELNESKIIEFKFRDLL